MELGTKRALAVKKVVAFQLKAGNSSAPTAKTSLKRKNQDDGERSLKKIVSQSVISNLVGSQDTLDLPRLGMGKGLMTTRSPVLNEPVPSYVPLLVKDKQHAIQMA